MDETVTGFNGANSRMEYTAQFNERLEKDKAGARTAAKTGTDAK